MHRLDRIQRDTELAGILHVHHQAIRRYVPDRPELLGPIGHERLGADFDRLSHDPPSQIQSSVAVRCISVPASAFDTGQFCLASSACLWKVASSMPGMSASVSSSILVMENPSPTLSSVTFAPVWMRVGVRPARESCAVSAIVKHPAWAAPISSSGLVAAWPSSNRDLNEYGPSKAPLPTLSRPLPSARLPFHSASAFRVGMEPPFALPPFSVSLFDALLDLLGRVPAINGDYLAGDERCAVGTEPDDGARDLFRPADASDRMRGLQHLPHFRRG